jgi:hypothetical protein
MTSWSRIIADAVSFGISALRRAVCPVPVNHFGGGPIADAGRLDRVHDAEREAVGITAGSLRIAELLTASGESADLLRSWQYEEHRRTPG